jgi:AcrR family transcriptional regulator
MARTRSVHYSEHQALILDTASRLFAAQGFARTSVAALARACNCSKALLYHYYASKEAILYALLCTHLERLHATTMQALATSDDPEAQFRALVHASMTVYTESQDKHIVLINDLHCLAAEQSDAIRRLERHLTSLVADLLTRINPEIARVPHLRMPYTMMFYGLLNWTYLWYDAQGPIGPDAFAHCATELFLHGFKSLHVLEDEVPRHLEDLVQHTGRTRASAIGRTVLEKRDDLESMIGPGPAHGEEPAGRINCMG